MIQYVKLVNIFNEQVKLNDYRFPKGCYFRLKIQEFLNLKPENQTSSWGGKRKLPVVYDRDGAVMASYVLRSKTAIAKSIFVVKAFNSISEVLPLFKQLLNRVDTLERNYEIRRETEEKVHFAMNKMLLNTARQSDFAVLLEDNENIKKEIINIKELLNKIVKKRLK